MGNNKMGKRLCVITDAWNPQINGVVTTLNNLVSQAEQDGWTVLVIHPEMFRNFAAPGYPEIRLSVPAGMDRMIREFGPDHLHIATEGPLGLMARILFKRRTYTTAYHTQWAPFLYDILRIPKFLTWMFVRWFHSQGKVMVPTESIRRELVDRGVEAEVVIFSRGVDLGKLNPTVKHNTNSKPRLLSVGRISVEKNLEAFCELDHERFDLVMVGDGPHLDKLREKYPWVTFKGMLKGTDLANEYAAADCMVFTSKKDTFGLVIIESQCLGTPVAAYPVTGPIDVILPETGAMDHDIETAIDQALSLDRDQCRKIANQQYSWKNAWEQFKKNLVSR